MQLQPIDLYPFVSVSKETDKLVCNKTVSVLFSILNFLKDGQSLESDNIVIESLGNNLLHITAKVTADDVAENLELDFSTNGLY